MVSRMQADSPVAHVGASTSFADIMNEVNTYPNHRAGTGDLAQDRAIAVRWGSQHGRQRTSIQAPWMNVGALSEGFGLCGPQVRRAGMPALPSSREQSSDTDHGAHASGDGRGHHDPK